MQIAPNSILGKSHGHTAPSDKLNIAVVGIGGMGITNIQHVFETENIVALCDVDWKYAKEVRVPIWQTMRKSLRLIGSG